MFFILSKTASLLVLPSNVLILIGLVGLLLMATRFRRAGTWLAAICIVLITIAGFLPVGKVLARTLEHRFPRWDATRGAPDGIIVLGGPIDPDLSKIAGVTVVGGSSGRLFALARLAREFPAARIVYTGGNGDLLPGGPAEADFVYPLLDDFGIPRQRVTLESRSRNTFENAAFSKELIKPKANERWLLVTSAEHMPRAVGCFRRVGFPVEAYPVDRHVRPLWVELAPERSIGSGLSHFDQAMHEWIGLVAYWATGRTSAFFPAPVQ